MLSEFWRRIAMMFRRERLDRELSEEMRLHREFRERELRNGAQLRDGEVAGDGVKRDEARYAAQKKFGNELKLREASREMWGWKWLEDFLLDIRYGARSLRRNPGFTAVAVLTLAVGIGANTAIFTAVDATLWRLLPVTDPQTLVSFSISSSSAQEETDLPAAFVEQLRESGIFEGVTVTAADGLSFTYDDRAERIVGEVVSPNYFNLLGVRPILGQGFTDGVQSGHWAPEAVLSYGFWMQRFGGDPAVIGGTIHLNSYPFTIVGVSPPSFSGLARGTNYEIRIPILPSGQDVHQIAEISGAPDRWMNTTGRLRPGQSLKQAEAAANAQLQRFLSITSNRQIQEFKQAHVRLTSEARGDYERVDQFRAPLYVLSILAAIVLLIACGNLASMLLARAAARARELAIRSSIGAGRLRLIRQMLAESALLAMLGGAAGIALASEASALIARFIPQGHIAITLDLHPDSRALLYTLGLSLFTIVLFGVLPAIQATRGNLAGTLKSDSTASTSGSRAGLRKTLVASQVAFSLVLLVTAGIFIRSLSTLRPGDFRADPNHVLLFTMKPQQEIYSAEQKRTLMTELLRRVSTLPGVQSAALAENGPLGSRTDRDFVKSIGHEQVRADLDEVSPGFFDAVGIPRVGGRDFNMRDATGSALVAIVNQSLARTLYKSENPIGQRISIAYDGETHGYEIVGVVADAHYYELHTQARPGVWLALLQGTPYMPTLHVRYSGSDGAAVTTEVRQAFDAVDKGFPVFNIKTLELRIEDSLSNERMVANLATGFGFLAIALAAVGLYGVLAYTVSRRTREIGIRMALGASPRSVLWIIAREALLLAGAGIVAGMGAALATERLVGQFFNGMSHAGPLILAGCAALMLCVTAAAVSIPAMRAWRLDPLVALRHE
jgi:predicted permease